MLEPMEIATHSWLKVVYIFLELVCEIFFVYFGINMCVHVSITASRNGAVLAVCSRMDMRSLLD